MTERPQVPGPAASAALRRLELTIVRRLEGYLHGEHLGLLPGPGTDLAEARLYRPGEDDVRLMDWAVTARTTNPHVRDVIADRELETWALVDMSPSMDYGTAAIEKRELAVAAVGTIGYLTQKLGDRFGGFVLRSDQLRRWPPRSGRLALYGLLRSLLTEPSEPAATPGRGRTRTPASEAGPTLVSALDQMSRVPARRGLRIVVSDFLDGAADAVDLLAQGGVGDRSGANPRSAYRASTAPAWQRPMRRLAERHQVLAIEVGDPREREIPDVGVVWFTDPETGVTREVDTSNPRTRALFAQAAAYHSERVRNALRTIGVAHLELSTDRDWVTDLARFVFTYRRVAAKLHGSPTGGRR